MQAALTRLQAIKLARQFIAEELPREAWHRQTKDHIKAIVLYGSVAKGANRPDSDIDLLVFMPLAIEERNTAGEYVYEFRGWDINIVVRSIERLRRIAKDRKDEFQKEVFRGAEVIQAVDGEVTALLQSIASIGGTV